MRLHPDTGTVVDGDAATPGVQPDARLNYVAGDVSQGRTPDVVVSTIGALGLGPFADASLDINDLTNAAYAAIRVGANAPTRLYDVDLASGRARLIGTVGDGASLRGMAIEP